LEQVKSEMSSWKNFYEQKYTQAIQNNIQSHNNKMTEMNRNYDVQTQRIETDKKLKKQEIIQRHTVEREELENRSRVYFDFNPLDLPCLKDLRDNHFKGAQMYNDGDTLQKPCILFSFIPVGTRMDHIGWLDKTKMLAEKTGGRSVIVRVHEESSSSYNDTSLDFSLTSGIPGKSIVLKAKYRTVWDQTGMASGNRQVFIDTSECIQRMKSLIKELNL